MSSRESHMFTQLLSGAVNAFGPWYNNDSVEALYNQVVQMNAYAVGLPDTGLSSYNISKIGQLLYLVLKYDPTYSIQELNVNGVLMLISSEEMLRMFVVHFKKELARDRAITMGKRNQMVQKFQEMVDEIAEKKRIPFVIV